MDRSRGHDGDEEIRGRVPAPVVELVVRVRVGQVGGEDAREAKTPMVHPIHRVRAYPIPWVHLVVLLGRLDDPWARDDVASRMSLEAYGQVLQRQTQRLR